MIKIWLETFFGAFSVLGNGDSGTHSYFVEIDSRAMFQYTVWELKLNFT